MIESETIKKYSPLEISLGSSELTAQKFGYKVVSFLEKIILEMKRIVDHETDEAFQLLSYRWSYEAKDLSLFLRDSLLGLLKIENFTADGRKSQEELTAYRKELSKMLDDAIESVLSNHENYSKAEGNISESWIHESNPIHFITEQIEEILDQAKVIYRSRNKLYQIRNTFEDYRSTYISYMKERVNRSSELLEIIKSVHQSILSLSDSISKSETQKLISKLENNINSLEALNSLSPYQFIVLEDTSKLKLATHTEGSHLVTKSIDILSEISGWNSFNLVSPLKVIDANLKLYTERVLLGLFQLLNRLKARLEQSGATDIERNDIIQVSQKLIQEHSDEIVISCDQRIDELQGILEKYIVPSQLFSKEYNFLPSATVNQLSNFTEKTALERRYSWSRIKTWLATKASNLFSKYSAQEQLTAAGYISQLLSFDPESDANTLFLKNGFLGSSFTVDRTDLMIQVDQHFQLWNQGYGGGLLISGSHLSGKSTILEMIPLVYPEYISHHVVPGQKIDVRGYKKIMSSDLLDTLNFIIKYKGPEKCIVTIDDLNYYAASPEETFDLFHSVSTIISKYSKQIYFVVSMHRFLQEKLALYFDFKPVFSETISTNYMPTELIEQAVTTRAHAVANKDNMEENKELLKTSARKISKQANNNVGKAMLIWCMTNNGKYNHDSTNSQFKAFVRSHKSILTMLVMHGHLNEPKLRAQLNEIDQNHLKSEIKTLMQLRILERPGEGLISINPHIMSFVEAILDKT